MKNEIYNFVEKKTKISTPWNLICTNSTNHHNVLVHQNRSVSLYNNSSEMLKWQESGFFSKGVYVRKIGAKDFTDGKRVDFDLYV